MCASYGFGGPCFPRDNRALGGFARQVSRPLAVAAPSPASMMTSALMTSALMTSAALDQLGIEPLLPVATDAANAAHARWQAAAVIAAG